MSSINGNLSFLGIDSTLAASADERSNTASAVSVIGREPVTGQTPENGVRSQASPLAYDNFDRVTLSQSVSTQTVSGDSGKVAEVRAKLSEGTYHVSSSDLAEAMLQKGFTAIG